MILAIVALFIGAALGALTVSMLSGRAFEKGYKDGYLTGVRLMAEQANEALDRYGDTVLTAVAEWQGRVYPLPPSDEVAREDDAA